jgi:hypothetical protein
LCVDDDARTSRLYRASEQRVLAAGVESLVESFSFARLTHTHNIKTMMGHHETGFACDFR